MMVITPVASATTCRSFRGQKMSTYHRLRFVSDRQQSLIHVMNLVTLMSWITRNALQVQLTHRQVDQRHFPWMQSVTEEQGFV
jgi:hypothetical protein